MAYFPYSFWNSFRTGIYLYYNDNGITINSEGVSSPYPSTINIPNIGGRVKNVILKISGLSHNFPDDIDMLLAGPNGQNLVVMSDVGGGNPVSNINFDIDDAASIFFPDETVIDQPSYKPTDINDGADTFNSPAGTPNITMMTGFTGFNPVGSWNLYIIDDTSLDGGNINAWAIQVTTTR